MKDINKTLSKLGWEINTDSKKAKTLAIEDKKSLPPDCNQALGKAKEKLGELAKVAEKWIQTLKAKKSVKPEDTQVTKTSLSE